MRHFRAIKRVANAVVENKRLLTVCKKLGSSTVDVPEDPKRFSFTAPKVRCCLCSPSQSWEN